MTAEHSSSPRNSLTAVRSDGPERILRVIVNHEAGVAPERTVRADYLDAGALAAVLGIHSSQADDITTRLRQGIPYHDRGGGRPLPDPSRRGRSPTRAPRAPARHHTGRQLRRLYDQGCRGVADMDMDELLWRIFADVQDSYSLALRHEHVAERTVAEVTTTVADYLANHYGSR